MQTSLDAALLKTSGRCLRPVATQCRAPIFEVLY